MRPGARTFSQLGPLFFLGAIVAAAVTKSGAILLGAGIAIYLVLKHCNALDARDIRDETRERSK